MYPLLEEKASKAVQHPVICMAVIALAVIASFFPTFGNELMTGWDDQWQVTNSFTSSGFTWHNLQAIFTESYQGQYSPLNQCMYTLLYAWGGYAPIYYHTACLLLHLANCMLVWILLKHILHSTLSTPLVQSSWIALLTTMLFSIHPLQVESVAWVSASKILLCTFFYLLATYTFIKYLHQSNRYIYYIFTIILFACAYGAKEHAVIFPLWLTLLCSFYPCNFRKIKIWALLLPFFALALFFGLMFIWQIIPPGAAQTDTTITGYTIWQRIVFSCFSIVEYINKWIVPYKLLYLYSYPMSVGEPLPAWMLVYPTLWLVVFITMWKYLKNKIVSGGLLFFLIHLLLVLHIMPLKRPSIVADRYIYLSAVGLSFVLVYFFVQSYTNWSKAVKVTSVAIVVSIFLFLGSYSYHRTLVWHNTESLKKELKEIAVESENVKSKEFSRSTIFK